MACFTMNSALFKVMNIDKIQGQFVYLSVCFFADFFLRIFKILRVGAQACFILKKTQIHHMVSEI